MIEDRWDLRRHMLSEQCDGCGGYRAQIFALDLPKARLWLCQHCWSRASRTHPGATEVLWTDLAGAS